MSLPQQASDSDQPVGAIAAVGRGIGWTIGLITRLFLIPIAILATFLVIEMLTHF